MLVSHTAIVRLLTAKGEVSAQRLCRLIHASAPDPRKPMDVQQTRLD